MNQSVNLTRKLAAAQESNASSRATVKPAIVYRIYTEFFPNLVDLTNRYFAGSTHFFGNGVYEGNIESAGVIEIIGTLDELQTVVYLAGDIKHVNSQASVLVTYANVTQVSV